MSSGSSIEWTNATWNPVSGCTRVSAGCDHCYAVTMTNRLASMGKAKYSGLTVLNRRGERHFNGTVRCHEEALTIPLGWRNPRRIFVNSMSDLFHRDVPLAFQIACFKMMLRAAHHTYQVLTKRPEIMADRMPAILEALTAEACYSDDEFYPAPGATAPNHIWLGTSVENQEAADERQNHLRAMAEQGWLTFVSYEPALGPVNWRGWEFLRWLISGGESGAGARPSHPDWHRAARDFCQQAGVAFFFKQWGAWCPRELAGDYGAHTRIGHVGLNGQFGGAIWGTNPPPEFMVRVGKKRAGRLLDGREWNEMPGGGTAEPQRTEPQSGSGQSHSHQPEEASA